MERISTAYLVAVAFALSACSNHPSEEEIQSEFDAYVLKNNSCKVSADCSIVNPGCPLGCYVAVRADKADAVQKKAKQLIDDWESGVQSCLYDCTEPPELACTDSVCTLAFSY